MKGKGKGAKKESGRDVALAFCREFRGALSGKFLR